MTMAKEYIEREAMIQRFKNTPLFSNFNTGGIFLREGVIDLVEKQTAADVVEVVRCEDCKFLMPSRLTTRHSCKWHQSSVKFDDFCSYGERRK